MDHSAYMGVAEIIHWRWRRSGYTALKASIRSPTDHRRLLAAGKFGERAQHDLEPTGAAAKARATAKKFINERLA
jgi:hypothetical protein